MALYIVLLPVLALFVRWRALHARRGGRLGFKELLGLAAAGERGGGTGAEDGDWTEELLTDRGHDGNDGGEAPKTLGEEVEYPAVEAWLRGWYFRQARTGFLVVCMQPAAEHAA